MKPLRICLVMFGAPFGTTVARLQGRIKLFEQISDAFYLLIDKMPANTISGEKVQVIDLNMSIPTKESICPSWLSSVTRLLKYITIQVRMSRELFKISKDVEIVIFSAGIPFVLPLMLQAKILRKKVIVFAGGSHSRSFVADNPRRFVFSHILRMLEKTCYHISTNIAAETESAIHFLELDDFKNKISIYGALIYLDTDRFRIKRDLGDRGNSVGYIGNLVGGKGVLNFVEASKMMLRQHDDIEFLIGGDGPLFSRIRDKLENEGLQHKAKLAGWIPHEDIPNYLNKLRLLVLPSYSEGLPGIILEAMACGTPVLATPVGGVPDVIKDGVTGFIIEDNTPECIAENVIRALNYHDLDIIINNARKLIEEEYTYEVAVERYRKILKKINKIDEK